MLWQVWQLRQEIAILRQQLNSRDSCSKVEAPAQDQMPQPAVDWEGMNVNRAMAPGGQLANVMYKTEGDPELVRSLHTLKSNIGYLKTLSAVSDASSGPSSPAMDLRSACV